MLFKLKNEPAEVDATRHIDHIKTMNLFLERTIFGIPCAVDAERSSIVFSLILAFFRHFDDSTGIIAESWKILKYSFFQELYYFFNNFYFQIFFGMITHFASFISSIYFWSTVREGWLQFVIFPLIEAYKRNKIVNIWHFLYRKLLYTLKN